MAASSAARPADRTDVAGLILLAAAAGLVVPGLLAFLAPAVFYDQIAGFPPENAHFIRDGGALQLALGALAVAAWRRPALRVPALAILAAQFALHTVSHVIDVGDSDPSWHGPATLVALALGTAIVAAAFVMERRS